MRNNPPHSIALTAAGAVRLGRGSLLAILLCAGRTALAAPAPAVILEAPSAVPRFEVAEFVVRVKEPPFQNPFTDAELAGVFTATNASLRVAGFADSPDGSVLRLRFSPATAGVSYRYELTLQGSGLDRRFTGTLRCEPSGRDGPVVVDPAQPKHFIYAGSRRPFYHLGYTAYHLLDPSNDDAQVDATIDYCARHGFNKIRFLLTGYPRDFDRRSSADVEYGVDDPWKAPNYGSKPGQVNPLPTWLGQPHRYDFTRFNVAHWQRVDRAVQRMRERGLVATCIVTIEKQNLPQEYGYEGRAHKPGHSQNSDWTRRCHWAIAMAGGYATYGDWSGGVSYFYMGEPGPGKAALQLKHLRAFFEALPFGDLTPHDSLTNHGFCLARPPAHYVFYFPRGGTCEIDLASAPVQRFAARWFDPRTGQWQNGPSLRSGKNTVSAPTEDDWALLLGAKEN